MGPGKFFDEVKSLLRQSILSSTLFTGSSFRRSGVGLAVVNGQLFAVGGFDGTTYLKTIEASTLPTLIWDIRFIFSITITS